MVQQAIDALTSIVAYVLGLAANVIVRPQSFLSVWMLAVSLVIAVLWYRRGSRHKRSWRVLRRALFPRGFLVGRSAKADLIMAGLGHVVFTTGVVVSALGLASLAASITQTLTALTGVAQLISLPGPAAQAITTIILYLAYELGYWIDHWLKHQVPFLWHFHKVHHSAETLSPVTNFRMHPIDGYLFAAIIGSSLGIASGLCQWSMGKAALPFEIAGTNAILLVFAYLIITLQHSHVWIPFTGRLGRWVLSPAHHQLHHSADPRHFNSNYGSVLAVFDRLFGTLRVPPRTSPRLRFGVDDITHDPHSLSGLYLWPVKDALAELIPENPRRSAATVKQSS